MDGLSLYFLEETGMETDETKGLAQELKYWLDRIKSDTGYIMSLNAIRYIIANAISVRVNKRYCNKCTCLDPNKRHDVIGGIIPGIRCLHEGEFGTLYINAEKICDVCMSCGDINLLPSRFVDLDEPTGYNIDDIYTFEGYYKLLNPTFIINIEY